MYSPTDHLPSTVRDRDSIRLQDEVQRRKALFRQARAVSSALRTITDRQRGGNLTRADGAILAQMILQNLRACVRRERIYMPTREMLAKRTGYSTRTVSTSLSRLKDAGIIVVARYAKGGRLGDKGHGLSTEFRSGCLQFLCDQLESLGYRLPKGMKADLIDLAKWAAEQVGENTEINGDEPPKPTGKKLPGTIVPTDRGTLSSQSMALLERSCRPAATSGPRSQAAPPVPDISHCNEDRYQPRATGEDDERRGSPAWFSSSSPPSSSSVPSPLSPSVGPSVGVAVVVNAGPNAGAMLAQAGAGWSVLFSLPKKSGEEMARNRLWPPVSGPSVALSTGRVSDDR